MSKTYQSPFTEPIVVETKEDAVYAIMHICSYCKKDAIGQFHCPYCDSKKCRDVQKQIASDFKGKET